MTLPSDKVRKCFKPKSNPRLFSLVILESGIGFFSCSFVWTMKLMKYCPEGFLDTVAVPIFPFLTLLLKTNFNLLSSCFVSLNFGIYIFFFLKSIFRLAGTSKL